VLTPKSRRDPEATRRRWADRLARFRSSGQTVARFCAAEGISEATFYLWKRALADTPVPPPAAPTLVPIRLTPSPAAALIELALPSGAVLRFPGDTPAGRVAEIVTAIEGRAC
jgi:transposase